MAAPFSASHRCRRAVATSAASPRSHAWEKLIPRSRAALSSSSGNVTFVARGAAAPKRDAQLGTSGYSAAVARFIRASAMRVASRTLRPRRAIPHGEPPPAAIDGRAAVTMKTSGGARERARHCADFPPSTDRICPVTNAA